MDKSGYIRRIAQIIEAGDRIPQEIAEWVRDFEPGIWSEMKHLPLVEDRMAMVIVMLIKKEAETYSQTIRTVYDTWMPVVIDKCQGETTANIVRRVEKQLAD